MVASYCCGNCDWERWQWAPLKNEGTVFDDDLVGYFSLLYATVMNALELNDHIGGWGGRIWWWRKEIRVSNRLMLNSDGTAYVDLL